MPGSYHLFPIYLHRIQSLFQYFRFDTFVFNYYNFRFQLNFSSFTLILHMDMDWLMVIEEEIKSYSKYNKYSRHIRFFYKIIKNI